MYLLYLHEGKWMGQGMKAMLERVKSAMGFSVEEYRKGLGEYYDLEANCRNYYWECAAYIAALGEVEESLGESDAKQKLMMSYKDKYPRRSAFRAEMREYGWLDI